MKTDEILKTIGMYQVFELIKNDPFPQPQGSFLSLRTCKDKYQYIDNIQYTKF